MNPPPARAAAILLAGGSSSRMRGSVSDKILAPLAGKPALCYSIEAFVESASVQTLVIVYRDDAQRSAIADIIGRSEIETEARASGVSIVFTQGGAQRQDSVWAGLLACPDDTEIALVHDCARPCITSSAIRESIAKAAEIGAACLAHPVTDTIKSADAYDGAYLPTTVDRAKLWAMETPQTFRFPLLRKAYRNIIEKRIAITDDLSAIEDLDQPVAFIRNPRPNPKLTAPDDFAYLDFILSQTKRKPLT